MNIMLLSLQQSAHDIFLTYFFSEGGSRGGYNNYNRGGGYTMNGGPPQSYSQPSKTF